MAKTIAKSIRISQEAYNIVNAAEGNGFNQKYENLIMQYPTQLAQMENLERQIAQKRQELESLRAIETKMRKIKTNLALIENLIPEISESLIFVSQKINQARPAADEIEVQRFNTAFENFTMKGSD